MAVVAFGAGEAWFVESPSQWKWGTLPAGVLRYFQSTTNYRVAHVYELVFGANNSFMMTWRGKDGKNYQYNTGLPPDLTAWIDQKNAQGNLIRNVPGIRLALGPNNASFFATDGKDYLWRNLPPHLNRAIEARRKAGGGFTWAPRIVALGVDQNYVMIDSGNGSSWVLDKYPGLDKDFSDLIAANHNRSGALRNIAYVSLDAFDGVNYVATTHDGDYMGEAPNGVEDAFVSVLGTLPKPRVAAAPAARGKRSSGFGTFLKLAAVVLNVEANAINIANGGGSGGSGGGGGGGGGGNTLDLTQQNMAFTQGLQDQTWGSVNAAANWNVQ